MTEMVFIERPARPGRHASYTVVRQLNPHTRPEAENKCCMCRLVLPRRRLNYCQRVGTSPLCNGCMDSLTKHQKEEERREQAYQDAKLERYLKRVQEQEAWREERCQERVQEWVNARPGRTEAMYPWGGISRRG